METILWQIDVVERACRQSYRSVGWAKLIPGTDLVLVQPSNYWAPERSVWKAADYLVLIQAVLQWPDGVYPMRVEVDARPLVRA